MRRGAGSNLRQVVIRRRLELLRKAWWIICLMWVAVVAVAALATWWIPDEFWQGIVLGVGVTTGFFLPYMIVRDYDGTFALRVGADAELTVSDTLAAFARRRSRAGQRWHVVNSLPFQTGDVDHVLVGSGGIYVVETKFRGRHARHPVASVVIDRAAQQSRAGARRVGALVNQHVGLQEAVRSIVALDGPGWPDQDGPYVLGDTLVTAATDVVGLDSRLRDRGLESEEIDQIVGAIAEQRRAVRRSRRRLA